MTLDDYSEGKNCLKHADCDICSLGDVVSFSIDHTFMKKWDIGKISRNDVIKRCSHIMYSKIIN